MCARSLFWRTGVRSVCVHIIFAALALPGRPGEAAQVEADSGGTLAGPPESEAEVYSRWILDAYERVLPEGRGGEPVQVHGTSLPPPIYKQYKYKLYLIIKYNMSSSDLRFWFHRTARKNTPKNQNGGVILFFCSLNHPCAVDSHRSII